MDVFYSTYSPVGDIVSLILCLVFALLRHLTYSKNEIKLKVFTWSINLVFVASVLKLCSHIYLSSHQSSYVSLIIQDLYYICLAMIFMNYSRYIVEIFGMEQKGRMKIGMFIIGGAGLIQITNLSLPLINYLIGNQNTIAYYENLSFYAFTITYIYCIIFIGFMLCKYKKIIMSKIWTCFVAMSAISVSVVFIGYLRHDMSFFTITFLLPLITAYCLLHNNPYNLEFGTLDANAFENYLTDLSNQQKNFLLACLYLDDIKDNDFIKDFRTTITSQFEIVFKKSHFFKLNDKKYILIIKEKIPAKELSHYLSKLKVILDAFHKKYKVNYKLTFISSNQVLEDSKNYIQFNKYLENKSPLNSIVFSSSEDVNNFIKNDYIVSQLNDIVKNNDLNDKRVLVYCQPVFNVKTKKYDTAEALMRLNLEEIGMIYPDVFIPLAEKHDYIHSLSLIILNKVCKEIKELEKNNYDITRISVNFSVSEFVREDFCESVINIIKNNDVPFDKIAFELTETETEFDYLNIKEKIKKLKKLGIYFYLDDFGTGYSNIARIMQLPFDVIKFDRSLVAMADSNKEYQYVIQKLSIVFKQLGYNILFEGIENNRQEEMCIEINTGYLQGYKYSKPIDIKNLKNFLSRV